jgi:hypothetical protein
VVVCGITEEVDRAKKIAVAAATVCATVQKIIVASPSAKIGGGCCNVG